MAFSYDLSRSEPYSPWERKHAFKHGYPFSDRPHKYWCFKNKCDAIFASLGQVAQHEKFAHSWHPLTGDYSDWLERIEEKEEVGTDIFKMKSAESAGQGTTQRSMKRIGMEFFGRENEKEEL